MRRRSSSPARKPSGSWAAARSIEAAAGASDCTITSPPAAPRPERPANWATIAKVRSSARKSGKRRVASASRIALSVTSGKSWPLATICVPTRTALAASPNSARIRAWAPRLAVVSESSRNTGIGASRAVSSSSISSVPAPARASVVEEQTGQARGARSEWLQWWQTRRPDSRWTISETSQLGQPQWCPQERQVSQGAKPRRLTITIALRPAARTSSSAVQVSACSGPERGSTSRMSTTLTGGMRRPSTRRGSSRAGELEPGLRARRRGAGDEDGAVGRRPVAGDGAGVVGRVALLLVARVVLLVDDDQAEVPDRGEDRRARTDANLRLAAAQPRPLVEAFAVGE